MKFLVEDVTEETECNVEDTEIAGSTAILVYFDKRHIYVASIGDSKAILGHTDFDPPLSISMRHEIRHQGQHFLMSK